MFLCICTENLKFPFTIHRLGKKSWWQAHKFCNDKGLQLPNIASYEAFAIFKRYIEHHNITHAYIGAVSKRLPTLYDDHRLQSPYLKHLMYKHIWQWENGRPAYININVNKVYIDMCALMIRSHQTVKMKGINCQEFHELQVVCMPQSIPCQIPSKAQNKVNLTQLSPNDFNVSKIKPCSSGHYTRDFLMCNPIVEPDFCTERRTLNICVSKSDDLYLWCGSKMIQYVLACDSVTNCKNLNYGVDETLCLFKKCSGNMFTCRNHQCVSIDAFCDGHYDCVDGSDEDCVKSGAEMMDAFQRCSTRSFRSFFYLFNILLSLFSKNISQR